MNGSLLALVPRCQHLRSEAGVTRHSRRRYAAKSVGSGAAGQSARGWRATTGHPLGGVATPAPSRSFDVVLVMRQSDQLVQSKLRQGPQHVRGRHHPWRATQRTHTRTHSEHARRYYRKDIPCTRCKKSPSSLRIHRTSPCVYILCRGPEYYHCPRKSTQLTSLTKPSRPFLHVSNLVRP